MEREPFWEHKWLVWACLILVPPVGIVLLSNNSKYNVISKGLLALIFSAYFVLLFLPAGIRDNVKYGVVGYLEDHAEELGLPEDLFQAEKEVSYEDETEPYSEESFDELLEHYGIQIDVDEPEEEDDDYGQYGTYEPGSDGERKGMAITHEYTAPFGLEDATEEQKKAVDQAELYISFLSLSRQGVIDQLVYEGFDQSDAEFAADHLGADWSALALRQATEYLELSAFSYDGLYEQLTFEHFSEEEARYAVDECGADWKEQAAKRAKEYQGYGNYSRTEIIDMLINAGFTPEEATYGADKNNIK